MVKLRTFQTKKIKINYFYLPPTLRTYRHTPIRARCMSVLGDVFITGLELRCCCCILDVNVAEEGQKQKQPAESSPDMA
jgi:hypothetical protein